MRLAGFHASAARRRSGQGLVLGYLAVFALTIVTGGFVSQGISENRRNGAALRQAEAAYLAHGGMEDAIGRFMQDLAEFRVDANVRRYPAAGTLRTEFSPSASFPSGAVAHSVIEEASPGESKSKAYFVTSTLAHPADPSVRITARTRFSRRLISPFAHAAFYNGDLEILPAVEMRLSGAVHSNGDVYLDSRRRLILEEPVRAAGRIYNFRKSDGAELAGQVDSRAANGGAGTLGIEAGPKLAVPAALLDREGFYARSAGLRAVNDALFDAHGRRLREGEDIPPGTIATAMFWNAREGARVWATDIDLRKLAGYAQEDADGRPTFPNNIPENGLIYAFRDDTPPGRQPGVRLKNGKRIEREGGLTVASDAPIYIWGDFNTVRKQPAAVIADAVNILSRGWSDAASEARLEERQARDTIINCALAGGVAATRPGRYNGGLENFPRLHEDWRGRVLRLRGSFVALTEPQIATGAWQYGAPFYTAPIRDWDFDTDLRSGPLPPFAPWAVAVEREDDRVQSPESRVQEF